MVLSVSQACEENTHGSLVEENNLFSVEQFLEIVNVHHVQHRFPLRQSKSGNCKYLSVFFERTLKFRIGSTTR